MARYDFDDPDFEQWKREPFLALVMYEAQMQQAFGWDAYQQVFATYRALPDTERPKSGRRESALPGPARGSTTGVQWIPGPPGANPVLDCAKSRATRTSPWMLAASAILATHWK